VRKEPKTFLQRRKPLPGDKPADIKGDWVWKKGTRQVPYRLPELLAAEHDTVIVVEGEKDVDNVVAKLGLTATCNAGGAGKWSPELAQHFKHREVYILPDNDQPGIRHAEQVRAALARVARSVRIVKLPPKFKDVSIWIEAGGTADELVQLMKNATTEEAPSIVPEEPTQSSSKVTYFNDCGEFVQKRWVMKGLIAPGETSGWIGPPKGGKSALLGEVCVHCAGKIDWRGHKAKEACGVVVLALERADLWKRRLRAYAIRDGLRDLPVAVRGGIIDLMNPTSVALIQSLVNEDEQKFGCKVGLIIIDTYNKAIAAGGGDEDKARDQNRVAANLRRVHELLDVHIALVGHTGKDESRGARGSNAHLGDVDIMVQISGDEIKTAEVTGANDQPERLLAQFKIDVFEIDRDEDDEPRTTSMVSPVLVEATKKPTKEPKLTPNQKTMFGILHDAGKAGLLTEDWNAKGREAGIGVNRRADLHDIRKALRDKKMVREHADRWTVDHRS
jgi:5S rRNA maturation endonuclease (ribonuclease M5)